MYDIQKYKNKQFSAGGRTLVWFFDDEGGEKLLDDNLFITDSQGSELWCMKEAVGRSDTCVLLRQVSDGKFYFLTFNGFSAEVDINTLEVTDKKAHKR